MENCLLNTENSFMSNIAVIHSADFKDFEKALMEQFDQYFGPKMEMNPLFLKVRRDFKENITIAHRLTPVLGSILILLQLDEIGFKDKLLKQFLSQFTFISHANYIKAYSPEQLEALLKAYPHLTKHTPLLKMYALLDNK